MFVDTLTVITVLLGHHINHEPSLHLSARFCEKSSAACVQAAQSPQLRWKNIPPNANSLAIVVHDNKNYYWVAYNLRTDATALPQGINKLMSKHDEGVNSFGERDYRSPWAAGQKPAVVQVELYALNKRFSSKTPLSGEKLMSKMKKNTLAKASVEIAVS